MSEIYNPTQSEMNAIVDSYNSLGGPKELGMDFNTWKGTMGIGDVDKGFLGNTMDFLGSDSAKTGLAGLGLVKDVFGAYTGWKNAKDMNKLLSRELNMKEDMWNEQKTQIADFKADKKVHSIP